MFLRAARLKRIAAPTSLNLLFINTTSAASIAISVPAPIAIPISALVKAGASLIPSPTITTFPCFFRERMARSFPSGSTPAITSSTPARFAIAFAVRSLSPVSITTRIPICFNSSTAILLSSFKTSATAMIPRNCPSCAKNSGVFPSPASCMASFLLSLGTSIYCSINEAFPPHKRVPFNAAASPFPATAAKSSTSSGV